LVSKLLATILFICINLHSISYLWK